MSILWQVFINMKLDRDCFVLSAGNRPTVGTIKVMFKTHVTAALFRHGSCVFVARHVIGSRPIKFHSLLPRYEKSFMLS